MTRIICTMFELWTKSTLWLHGQSYNLLVSDDISWCPGDIYILPVYSLNWT